MLDFSMSRCHISVDKMGWNHDVMYVREKLLSIHTCQLLLLLEIDVVAGTE